MGDASFDDNATPHGSGGGAAPSLDDLDSLLASAADLAGELAREVGSTESATALAAPPPPATIDDFETQRHEAALTPEMEAFEESPTSDTHNSAVEFDESEQPSDAYEVEDGHALPADPDEPPAAPRDIFAEGADALDELDRELAKVTQLTDRAVEAVGAVEGVSGDAQILSAMQAAPTAPTETAPLSAADQKFLADMDDLTVSSSTASSDAFGAPPPRGGGAFIPRTPAVEATPPPTEPTTATAVKEADSPVGEPAQEEAAESPSDKRVAAVETALPRAGARKLRHLAVLPLMLSARGVVRMLEIFDKPFAFVPAETRAIAGWLAGSTLIVATCLWVWVGITGPPHREIPEPAVHQGSSAAPMTPASSEHRARTTGAADKSGSHDAGH